MSRVPSELVVIVLMFAIAAETGITFPAVQQIINRDRKGS
jgi:hypothetical protein